MTGGTAALAALWRHERRTLWRDRRRSALLVALVALPVLALVAATSLWRTLEQPLPGQPPRAPSDGFEAQVLFVAGGFGALEAGLLVAAAFLVGLRRRQRELGLLGAAGATRGQILLGALLACLAIAALGCGLGLTTGLLTAAVVAPWLPALCERPVGPFSIAWFDALQAAGLGFTAAVLACLGPAWAASGWPIRRALGARRPPAPPLRGRDWAVLAVGLAGVAVTTMAPTSTGTQAAGTVLFGSLLAALGIVAASGTALRLGGRLAAALPLAWRHALRAAARHRGSTAPAIAACTAGIAVAVATSAVVASVAATAPGTPQPAGIAAVAAALAFAVVVMVVATGLTAAETRHERRLLSALGADAAHLGAHAAAGTAWLAALAALLAVPAGLLPAYGITTLADQRLPFVVPWATLATVTLAFPALVYGAIRLWPRAPVLSWR